ncbi:gliding motility-associated C-terminal domain-containing protein [uncultured Maribacter sp.]|uniref:T9SS type B sorting domain-containing protein n=1 Tax=uncultured Maribacter sp. TaxID=431308 RepID=UPI002632A8A4|nr:gliding motility-associated C-terminal domain-containing protein [uncultured Maribacter sp.]
MKLKKENICTSELFKKGYLRFYILIILLFSGFIGHSQVVTIERVGAHPVEAVPQPINNGRFRVTRTGSTILPLTVTIAVTGTATPVTDYAPIATTVTIPSLATNTLISLGGIVDDTLIEGNETIILTVQPSVFYTVGVADTATLIIVDDDVGTVRVIESLPNAEENGPTNGRFQLRLSGNNNTGTTLTVNYSLTGTATGTAGATQDYTITGVATFSATQLARNINVIPIDDAIIELDETVILTITGTSSTSFTPLVGSESGTVTIADNDTAGVNIDTTIGTTTEAGGTASFVFTLSTQPSANVTIPISGYDVTETSGAASVVLTPLNWSTGSTLVVTGVDDAIADGDITYNINTGNITSTDLNYNALTGADVPQLTVTNTDDEVAEVNIDTTIGTTTEAGGTASFVFTLSTQPSANVTIPISGYDVTETSGAASVVLTPLNWSTGATLVVTGLDDSVADGDIVDVIITGDVTSTDLNYNALTGAGVPQLTVTNTDDDVAGVNISTLAGTTTEAGGTADFVFTLTSQPTANVSININGYDVTETSGPTSILLTPTNWDTGETLTITGVNDAIIDGDIDNIINTGNVTSGDPNYQAISGAVIPQLTVTNLDDDGCGTTPVSNGLSAEFCGNIQANLNDYTDSTPPLGMVLRWSRSSNPFNVGARLTQDESENITSEGSFFGYFYDEANDCASGTLEIELISNEMPTIDEVTGASNCGPGSLLLSATVSSGASVKWYDSLTGGIELGVGDTFSTGSLETTTSFYAEAEANGCVSRERVEVIATIIPEPFSGTASNTIACSLASTQQPLSAIDLDDRLLGNPDAGDWSFVSGPATLEIDADNVVNFLDQEEGDYVFRYTTNNLVAPCTSNASTEVTISVTADCTPDPIDIEVLKTVDNPNATAGEKVVFTITVNNLSPNRVQNIVIGDLLASGFDYVSDTSNGTYDIATGMWQIAELEGMATVAINIEVTVLSEGIYTNVAELLESFPVDNNTTNDRAEVSLIIDVPEGVDLEIVKTANSNRPLIGDEVVFTITVKNMSNEATVNQIRVSDLISESFIYVSHTLNEDYNPTTGMWLISELAKDEEATLEITVTVPNAGTHTNTATIIGSVPTQTDSNDNEGNNTSSVEVLVSLPTEADCGFVFNQFSPNGDGTNDFLKIQCIEQYPENRLQIYDRYGNLIYAVARYTNNWDGIGDNGEVPDGTYFYVLDLGDDTEVLKGWIQLIR